MAKLIPWSQEELQKLRVYYPSLNQDEIMNMLPLRSYQAIKYKAKELQIRKRIRSTPSEYESVKGRKIDSGYISVKGNIMVHRMG